MLVRARVHSRLDYCNTVLVGLPAYLQRRLQSVLNAAARLIYRLGFGDHITHAVVILHWLRVSERIEYIMAASVVRYTRVCVNRRHPNALQRTGLLVRVALLATTSY